MYVSALDGIVLTVSIATAANSPSSELAVASAMGTEQDLHVIVYQHS